MFHLSKQSLGHLAGVHPDLVRVVERAIHISDVDFGITEGVRSFERQQACVAAGKSKTLHSRHLTGHAVDVAAYIGSELSWDPALFEKIASAIKRAAAEFDVPIVWGGDWRNFGDGCHFELDRHVYPAPNAPDPRVVNGDVPGLG